MKINIISALTEKSFLLLWIGEIFTLIAGNAFNFFLILVVFELTHSNTAVAGVVLSITIPSIIFGMIAGAFVDRWNKKKVLFFVNISRAVILTLLAFSVQNLLAIYILSFIFSFLTQFFIPAELPILPLLVHKNHLYSANALFSIAIYGSILVAFVLTGPMIIFLKPFGVLLLLAAMLIISSLFILFIKLKYAGGKALARKFEEANIFKDMHYTLSLISHNKEILQALIFLALTQSLILVVAAIAPGYASSVLKIPVVQFPILFVAPAALGTAIGAWLLVNYLRQYSKNSLITFGVFLSAFSMLIMPYISKVTSKTAILSINASLPVILQIDSIHIVIFLAFILGLSNSLIFVPANTLLQEQTIEHLRGKVYGFLNTFVGVLSLLPIIVVGGLADVVGVGSVISGIGIFILIIGIIRIL